MKILYKKILRLEVVHDYYLKHHAIYPVSSDDYDISDTFTLVPTLKCAQTLKNFRWVFRSRPYGGDLYAYVDEITSDSFRTKVPVDQPVRLTFWLSTNHPYFHNITNLPLTGERDQIYYFSNLPGNHGKVLSLTRTLPEYEAGKSYFLGQLVTYGSNTLEAIRYQLSAAAIPGENDWMVLPIEYELRLLLLDNVKSLPAEGRSVVIVAKIGTSYHLRIFDGMGINVIDPENDKLLPDDELAQNLEKAFEDSADDMPITQEIINKPIQKIPLGLKQPLPTSQFVSGLDRRKCQCTPLRYTIDSTNPGDIFRFALRDINNETAFRFELKVPKEQRKDASIDANLNFSGQAPGFYKLYLDDHPIDEFVLYDPLLAQNVFALIEIALKQDHVPEDFSLLKYQDGEIIIQPKTYVIRFKNRSTWWRYRHQTDHGFCLPGQSNLCKKINDEFVVIDSKTYVTKQPQGLLQKPKKILNNDKRGLPAANGNLIKPIREAANPPLPEHTATIFSDVHI